MKRIRQDYKGISLILVIMIILSLMLQGCGGNITIEDLVKNKITRIDDSQIDSDDTTTGESGSKNNNGSSGEDTTDDEDTTKDGDTTKKGDGTTKKGDDTTKKGDGTTKKDDDTTKKGENTTKDEGTTKKNDDTTKEPSSQTITQTQAPTKAPTTTPTPTQAPTTAKPQTPTPDPINIASVTASGTAVSNKNGFTIDYSNASDGYVMIKSDGATSGVVYVQIRKNDKSGTILCQELYDTAGSYMSFTLTNGSGTYCIRILQGASTSALAEKNSVTTSVNIKSETSPFIYSCKNASFTSTTNAVKISYEQCAGISSDKEKVTKIANYIYSKLSYNYDLAAQIKNKTVTNYTPSADRAISSGKGICSDYACLFAVMLRAQRIPTKVAYGYAANGVYHAWNYVYYDGKWNLYDLTYTDDGGKLSSSYTVSYIY